jgi:hypothetical protein
MTVSRFSLRTFFAAVAYIAVVIVAMVAGTPQWAAVVFSISLAIVLVATLAAFFLSNSKRTFWRGFSLVAWIYLFIAFGPMEGQLRKYLVTDQILSPCQRILARIQAARHLEPGFQLRAEGEGLYHIGPRSVFNVWGGSWERLQRIGHSLSAIVLGLVGGCLAVNFKNRNATRSSA